MKITKKQALDIIKLIAHYELLTQPCAAPSMALSSYITPEPNRMVKDLDDLRAQFEGFLLNSIGDDDEEQEKEDEDCTAETNETQPCSQGEGRSSTSKAGSVSGEEEFEEEFETDGTVCNSDLNALGLLQGRICSSRVGNVDDKVSLEFEDADVGRVDLIVDGFERIKEIGFVKRTGTEIHVAEYMNSSIHVVWHVFGVNKFPRDWLRLLGAGCLYRIIAGEER